MTQRPARLAHAGLIKGDDGLVRCWWGASAPDYAAYHDAEWGRPVMDDRRLFEKICLNHPPQAGQLPGSVFGLLRGPGRPLRRPGCHPVAERRWHRPASGQD